MSWESFGQLFIILGVAFIGLGLLMIAAGHMPGSWLTRFGQLPGDIHYQNDRFQFYFPLTSMLLVSALLTLLFRLFFR